MGLLRSAYPILERFDSYVAGVALSIDAAIAASCDGSALSLKALASVA